MRCAATRGSTNSLRVWDSHVSINALSPGHRLPKPSDSSVGGSMSERLKTFLVGLASDPERMGRFLVNPAGELDGAGLSVDEKTAVLARDSAALRHALGA